jgi:hypothetical protein
VDDAKEVTMSIFDNDIFGGLGDLGALPSGAVPIASLSSLRSSFSELPSGAELESRGVTHYTTQERGPTSREFTFYDGTGRLLIGPMTLWTQAAGQANEPGASKDASPARSSGDGLLPSSVNSSSGTPSWLPWALVGGGVLAAGAIAWAVTRTPKRVAVAANRRRRRRRARR